jgi:protein-tyrosine kinase
MGRIEDALAKLQARAAAENEGRPPHLPLARVSQEARPTPVDHAYGGKLVEVDFRALRSQALLAPDSQERRLADEYRVIKRPLINNANGSREALLPRGNLLMVASAASGEGKTFTCINLCLSIARETDWSVVLVDGDCAKPHLTHLFGAEREPGLMDLLRDPRLSFEDLVMPTNVPSLSLLPSGRRDEHAAELLASARMDSLCAGISASDPRRMIVFDSSPLFTTEAPVLASQMGQIAVVVQANRTPQQAVLAAIGKLDPAKAINLILNQASPRDAVPGYGDHYGYGYEEAGSYGQAS